MSLLSWKFVLDTTQLAEIKAEQEDIIGYVTTGDLSLSRGDGFALGAIPVVQYVALRKQAQRCGSMHMDFYLTGDTYLFSGLHNLP